MRSVKITILEFPRRGTSYMMASGSPGSDRSVSHISCFMIEVGCLIIYCCIAHYSQHWCISITVSYMKVKCLKLCLQALFQVFVLLIELCCLVICCCTADVCYILLTNVSYTALLVSNAFCIQRMLKYPSISLSTMFSNLVISSLSMFPPTQDIQRLHFVHRSNHI